VAVLHGVVVRRLREVDLARLPERLLALLLLGSMLLYQFSPIFCQFSAKKLSFFSKANVMIKFWQKIAVVGAKNAKILSRNQTYDF
jgi:hypothetical protein